MDLFVRFGVHSIETLFFAGLLGSLAVVLVSLVGDLRDLVFRPRTSRPDQQT